jgi:hypothetical protein
MPNTSQTYFDTDALGGSYNLPAAAGAAGGGTPSLQIITRPSAGSNGGGSASHKDAG